MKMNTDGTFLCEDVTRLILLALDPPSLDQTRLTCRLYYNSTEKPGFWTQKLELDFGRAPIQVHEDHDEWKFLRFAPLQYLLAVKRDDVALLRLLQVEKPTRSDALVAVHFGRLDLLRQFKEKGVLPPEDYAVEEAARCGHLPVIEWLEEQDVYINEATAGLAALGGDLDTFKFAIEPYWHLDDEHGGIATSYGHIEILNWMTDSFDAGGCGRSVQEDWSEDAVYSNQTKVLNWFWNHGIKPTDDWVDWAIEAVALNSLKWLVSHGFKFKPEWIEKVNRKYNDFISWTVRDPACEDELEKIRKYEERYEELEKIRKYEEMIDWLQEQS